MSLPGRLIRLYPDSFRNRWADALENEAQAGGWRTHLDMVVSIADMWLHPAFWPAESSSQRRARAASMGATVALTCWFFAHVAVQRETRQLSAPGTSMILMACAVAMIGGLLVIFPRPYLSWRAAARIASLAIRRLAVPMVLAAIVVVVAHTVVHIHGTMLRNVVMGVWWCALAVGTVQLSRLIGGLSDEFAHPPSRLRLEVGMWTVVAAGGASGLTILRLGIERAGFDPVTTAAGALLVLLTGAVVMTLLDLYRLPTPDHDDH